MTLLTEQYMKDLEHIGRKSLVSIFLELESFLFLFLLLLYFHLFPQKYSNGRNRENK